MNKKRFFSPIILITAILLVSILSCCESDLANGEENSRPIESISNSNSNITVGTDPTYPPFEFMDQGNITGFDIEFIEQVFLVMDKDYDLESVTWDPEFCSIIEGNIDLLISAVPYMEEKDNIVDFSVPYYTLEFLLITLLDSEIKIKEDLIGKDIGMLDTSVDILEEDYLDEYEVSTYTEVSEMVDSLKEQDIEGFLLSVPLSTVFLEENIEQFKILEKIQSQRDFVIVLEEESKLKSDIDSAIEEIKKDQFYKELYDKWFNSYF